MIQCLNSYASPSATLYDPVHAEVHARDNSRLNESSFVMAKAYKKEQHNKKHTRSTRNIHIDNMKEFKLIYYFYSMKNGGIIS